MILIDLAIFEWPSKGTSFLFFPIVFFTLEHRFGIGFDVRARPLLSSRAWKVIDDRQVLATLSDGGPEESPKIVRLYSLTRHEVGFVATNLHPGVAKMDAHISGQTATLGSATKPTSMTLTFLLIGCIGLFYFATIRQGHGWGDDFASYIQEAKDIANGLSYTHSNYLFNPQNTDVGPSTYPPIYPLVLSPIYAVFGMNLTAMKVENVLFFLGFLFVFARIVKTELQFPYSFAAVATVGLNPYLWSFKDNIVSEITFLFFLYLSFLWAFKVLGARADHPRIADVIVMAALIYLSYGTRTIGIFLLPALFCAELAKTRKLPRFSILVAILFLIPWFVQSRISASEAHYYALARGLSFTFKGFFLNVWGYLQETSNFWGNGYSKIARLALFFMYSALAVAGYTYRFLTRRTSIMEFYVPFHLLATLLWPSSGGLRYLIPILPLYVLYGYVGVTLVGSLSSRKVQTYVFVTCIALITLSYAGQYSRSDFGPITAGIAKSETQDFFTYVRTRTDPKAVFIFRKPKALGLFGERPSSVYPATGTDQEIWRYLNSINATYLVVGPPGLDDPFWPMFVARNRLNLTETYANTDFTVYRVILRN